MPEVPLPPYFCPKVFYPDSLSLDLVWLRLSAKSRGFGRGFFVLRFYYSGVGIINRRVDVAGLEWVRVRWG